MQTFEHGYEDVADSGLVMDPLKSVCMFHGNQFSYLETKCVHDQNKNSIWGR